MIIRSWRSASLLVFFLVGSQITFQAAQGPDQKSFEKAFKVNGEVELEVKTGSEDLTVRSGEEGRVTVRCIVRPQNDHDFDDEDVQKAAEYFQSHIPVRQEGNRIVVEPTGERSILRHVNVQFEITAPTNSHLTYETGSGDLSVEAIQGPVNYSSGSGDIQVRSVQKGATVHTSSGDVTLEDMGKGPIDVATQSGDVTVRLDLQAGYNLTAHTGSGDFSISSQLTLQAGDTGREIRGKVRGGGAPVSIRTGSGDIRIE